ncbi:sulfotransferase ssu-1-like [Centruroides vittatus]|uniref:sulfotransferase ssu-1-like n=1 Tax=Centruroides vittatus TaxID=120091 RepID=UPI0035103928
MEDEIKRPNYIDVDGFRLPGAFSPEAFRSAIKYKPKRGEIYVVTYPKCGTTWMQCIIMCIVRKGRPIANTLDYAKNSPFIEFAGADALDYTEDPGAIKTHLPFSLTPFSPHAKYIYVARNPKDCCVSFYHHTKMIGFYNFSDGTFDEYFELFVKGETDFGDYFDHHLSWYERKDDPNVYFLTYEDLKSDTRGEILKLAKFMGEEHYETLVNNPDILDKVLEYSSVNYMKKTMNESFDDLFIKTPDNLDNLPSGVRAFAEYMKKHPRFSKKADGQFVRKGIVGDWKNHFSPEQERRMEERIKEKTKGSDLMKLWNK